MPAAPLPHHRRLRLDESLFALVEEEAEQVVGPVEEARSRCAGIELCR